MNELKQIKQKKIKIKKKSYRILGNTSYACDISDFGFMYHLLAPASPINLTIANISKETFYLFNWKTFIYRNWTYILKQYKLKKTKNK